MHSPFRKRGVILAGLLALALAAALPTLAVAKPEPGAKKAKGFRLFARPLGAMTINNVYCGLSSDGQVCVDSTNSSTIGGGYWPKGTADQYIFNSGLQLAGVVGADGGPWAGDTTGAFFFDPKGTTQHGTQVEPIYNTSDPDDFANLPAAGYVPTVAEGDSGASNFNLLLQGRAQASQGDVWWMSWDGDPSLNAGRKHPLGVVVETRGMGWNFPTGNGDILYYIYTFYNVTTTNPADYVGIRPAMRDILVDKAIEFQSKNNATFNVTLPTGGYTLEQLYAAFATDMDVASAGTNYSSVNLPFALGYTYVDVFEGEAAWTFDPTLFAAPFMPAAGFAGIKYLKSPSGPGAIQLFSNTINGSPFPGAFNDPQNTTQLWRYLSGNISVPAGDQPCNTGVPSQTRICFINNNSPQDMRFFQSSTALTLPPGGQGSIVVAYIFAAPVAVGGCPSPGCTSVKPGNPALLGVPAQMVGGVNLVDSITGFLSATDLDASGLIEQSGTLGPEWEVVTGSLLGKSYTAQAVFDARFLLPFSPDPPKFFLIPSNNQVTVVWQPSPSETSGDPYYAIASDVASALYDPNYRQFDVEGYRIYRGRVDSPDQLFLIAQFDFSGTIFNDYDGVINPTDNCAPELGIGIAPNPVTCPVAFDSVAPGVPRTVANPVNIVSPFIETKFGDRLALANGLAITVKTDTVSTGFQSGDNPPLANTGVPYIYVDNTARNNFRYFYVVTAFDVNSWASGPTSLESPKGGTISVTPQALASNLAQSGTLTPGMIGRGVNMSQVYLKTPSMRSDGTFSGPFPPATPQLGFVGFASQVVGASGALSATLDSFHLGGVNLSGCCGGGQAGVPAVYYYTISNGVSAPSTYVIPLQQDLGADVSTDVYFAGPAISGSLASMYGGDGTYGTLSALFTPTITSGPIAGDWGLGSALGEPGFSGADMPAGVTGTNYNGARWFDGPSPATNEVTANPISGSCGTGTAVVTACAANGTTNFNNAGVLTGVATVYQPMSYNMYNREWRNVGETPSGARRAADYNVYWGTGGVVDSVIDISHNVVVPFQSTNISGGWGILNTSAQGAGGFDNRPTVLTPTDWTCVEPLRSLAPGSGAGTFFPCAAPTGFLLSNTATLGAIAFGSGNAQSAAATKSDRNPANIQPNGGFMMYIAGTISGFDMTALPAAGTVWSLRDYTGIIYGGNGTAQSGSKGPYSFVSATRPFTAIGATMSVQYDVVNDFTVATSNADLTTIHTIPDPYYVTNAYESDYTAKIIKFVNLPLEATIRIYSSSGVLVRVLNYSATENGGMLDWNVRNRNNQVVASGVYFYHVESGDARYVGRMTIVNFAK